MSDFDRDYSLADLLPSNIIAAVGKALSALLGSPVAVLDETGSVVWGELASNVTRAPLVLELEPVAYLAANAPPSVLAAAASLLNQILQGRARYLMAASVHTASVAADYEALVRKHEALQASEERYRKLSEELEQRVAQQVALLEQQRLQLYQMEKLASVGQLAAGVAHEINNPIGFVRSNLNTLKGYLEQFGEIKNRLDPASRQDLDVDFLLSDSVDLLAECFDGIDRVSRIVRDLKGFSNVDGAEQEMVDLNESLRLAATAVAPRKPEGVNFVFDLQPLPQLLCLPGHLNQVFCGILINALQAVGPTGEIKLSSRADDSAITICIEDNGIGIAAENLSRVFDPFFTTRDVGQGTGLGLTVARDVVMAHEGTIQIDSEPGKGTRVTIRLPL